MKTHFQWCLKISGRESKVFFGLDCLLVVLQIFVCIWWTYERLVFYWSLFIVLRKHKARNQSKLNLLWFHPPRDESDISLPGILKYGDFHELEFLFSGIFIMIINLSLSLSFSFFLCLYTGTHFIYYSQIFQIYMLCSFLLSLIIWILTLFSL